MFSPRSHLVEQRAESLSQKVAALNDAAETWFDGTEASITARRRFLEAILHQAKQLGTDQAICLAAELETELIQMANFAKIATIGAGLEEVPERTAATGPLSARGREFVATRVSAFVTDNADAVSNGDELDLRAVRYAERHVSGLPVEEAEPIVACFREKVAEAVRPQGPVVREAQVRTEFDDALLYG